MPRTARQILAHADELARRFAAEPDANQVRDATTLRELARAVQQRARAESDVASAVATARADGHTVGRDRRHARNLRGGCPAALRSR